MSGYGASAGVHTLTAIATNGAGLTATTTLTYTVAKPAAISRLTLAKDLTLDKLARAGILVTLRVATASTRVVLKLSARVPNPSGSGTRAIALGGLTKRVPAGTAKLRITLTAKAKRQLRELSRATLRVTATARSEKALDASLQRSMLARAGR